MTTKQIKSGAHEKHPSTVLELILVRAETVFNVSREFGSQHPKDIQDCLDNAGKLAEDFFQCVRDMGACQDCESKSIEFWNDKRHSLRSLLNSIQGYAEFVLEECSDNKFLAKRLHTLIDVSRKLLPFINSIRSFEDLKVPPKEVMVRDFNKTPSIDNNVQGIDILVVSNESGIEGKYKTKFPLHKFVTATSYTPDINLGFHDIIIFDFAEVNDQAKKLLNAFSSDQAWGSACKLIVCAQGYTRGFDFICSHVDDCIFGEADNPFVLKHVSLWVDLIVARKNSQLNLRRLRGSQEVLAGAIENIDSCFVLCDVHDRIVLCNTKFKRFYPYMRDLNIGESTYEQLVLHHMSEDFYDYQKMSSSEWFKAHIEARLKLQESVQKLTDGRWVKFSHNRTSDGGIVSIHTDVTDQKKDEDRLTYLAHHDSLTGLPNRLMLDKKVPQIFDNCRDRGLSSAVIYFDLDGFKQINDEYGHDFGDDLLVEVAHRLRGCCRSKDAVARVGGDEFVVVTSELKNDKEGMLLARRILKEIGTVFVRGDVTVTFGVSMGVAYYPSDHDSYGDLIKMADQAMYHSKKMGKGKISLFRDISKIHLIEDLMKK